jgi:hypothetical protein
MQDQHEIKLTLLPCPFCGAEPNIEEVNPTEDSVRWTIGCPSLECYCYRSWRTHGSREEAIEAWQRREHGPAARQTRAEASSSTPAPGSGAVGGGRRTRKGYVFGKLILTTVLQAQGAPLVDSCWASDAEGRRYKGWAILLKPWRRDRHGASEIQPALVVGWRQRQNA